MVKIEEVKVKDLMTSESIATIKQGASLSEALGKMHDYDVHELPVIKGKNELLGLVSYEALIKRRSLPLSTHVENVMITPPKLSTSDSLTTAAETLLSSGIRAAPVTSKDDTLIGVISRSDLIKVIPKIETLSTISVGSVMTPSPIYVFEHDSVREARDRIRVLDEHTIPVVDSDERLSGVIGLKDIARVLFTPKSKTSSGEWAGRKESVDIAIKSIMRTPPITTSLGTSVGDAANLMIKNGVTSVIVSDKRKLIGVVSQVDLIELIAKFKEKEEVYVQITGLEEDDPFIYESMYGIIQKSMKKIGKVTNPQILRLHVIRYDEEGEASKYSIRGRLLTSREMFYARGIDWDLMRATDEVLRRLERMVRREKKKKIDKWERQTPKIEEIW